MVIPCSLQLPSTVSSPLGAVAATLSLSSSPELTRIRRALDGQADPQCRVAEDLRLLTAQAVTPHLFATAPYAILSELYFSSIRSSAPCAGQVRAACLRELLADPVPPLDQYHDREVVESRFKCFFSTVKGRDALAGLRRDLVLALGDVAQPKGDLSTEQRARGMYVFMSALFSTSSQLEMRSDGLSDVAQFLRREGATPLSMREGARSLGAWMRALPLDQHRRVFDEIREHPGGLEVALKQSVDPLLTLIALQSGAWQINDPHFAVPLRQLIAQWQEVLPRHISGVAAELLPFCIEATSSRPLREQAWRVIKGPAIPQMWKVRLFPNVLNRAAGNLIDLENCKAVIDAIIEGFAISPPADGMSTCCLPQCFKNFKIEQWSDDLRRYLGTRLRTDDFSASGGKFIYHRQLAVTQLFVSRGDLLAAGDQPGEWAEGLSEFCPALCRRPPVLASDAFVE